MAKNRSIISLISFLSLCANAMVLNSPCLANPTPKASKEHNKKAEQNEKKAESFFQKSLRLADSGKYKQAVIAVTNALILDPNNIVYICRRGDLFETIGKYNHSSRDFIRALNVVPKTGQEYFYKAYANYNLTRYSESLKYSNIAIKRKYTSQRVYKLIGKSYYKLDQFQKAIKYLEKSATMLPTVTGYLYLSRCCRRQDKLKQAQIYADKAAKMNTNDSEVLMEQAIVAYRMNKFEKAKSIYNAWKKATPKVALAYPKWKDFQYYCETEKKFDYYSKIISLSLNKNAAPIYERAILSSNMAKYETAANDMKRYLEMTKWKGKSGVFAACYSVICYRLSGKFYKSEEMAKLANRNLINTEWPFPVFLYLTGKRSESTLLANAGMMSNRKTQAHFFIGLDSLYHNRVASAEKHFSWVKKNGDARLDEYSQAVSELNRLRKRNVLQSS